jgi:hypothetical protein
MTERKCATCKYWPGTDETCLADCLHRVPEWVRALPGVDNPRSPLMLGTWGLMCQCWAERTAEDNHEQA